MKQVLIDILDAIAYVINGAPHDPKRFARKPPANWHKATPEGDVPQRKQRSEPVDLNVWTAEEILAMTEAEFRQKIGISFLDWPYEKAKKEALKQINKKNRGGNAKPVEIEL